MHTTKKEIESAFRVWLGAIGGHHATSYGDIGGYSLDHNSVYGGWRIEQIQTDGGGIREINYGRMPSGEFKHALNLASESVREYRNNQTVRATLEKAQEALRNVPVVGEVYDQQHSDTAMYADIAITNCLARGE